jgi:hypothetical protein
LKERLNTVTEERDVLLKAKGELEASKAVLEKELKELKKEMKETEIENKEEKEDLKVCVVGSVFVCCFVIWCVFVLQERLNDAIQARWSLEEALRAAGVDPDEVDAALLSEKMKG